MEHESLKINRSFDKFYTINDDCKAIATFCVTAILKLSIHTSKSLMLWLTFDRGILLKLSPIAIKYICNTKTGKNYDFDAFNYFKIITENKI